MSSLAVFLVRLWRLKSEVEASVFVVITGFHFMSTDFLSASYFVFRQIQITKIYYCFSILYMK